MIKELGYFNLITNFRTKKREETEIQNPSMRTMELSVFDLSSSILLYAFFFVQERSFASSDGNIRFRPLTELHGPSFNLILPFCHCQIV